MTFVGQEKPTLESVLKHEVVLPSDENGKPSAATLSRHAAKGKNTVISILSAASPTTTLSAAKNAVKKNRVAKHLKSHGVSPHSKVKG